MGDEERTSFYGWRRKPEKVKGEIVGWVEQIWEVECAIPSCVYYGGVLAGEVSAKHARKVLRDHYREMHVDA